MQIQYVKYILGTNLSRKISVQLVILVFKRLQFIGSSNVRIYEFYDLKI